MLTENKYLKIGVDHMHIKADQMQAGIICYSPYLQFSLSWNIAHMVAVMPVAHQRNSGSNHCDTKDADTVQFFYR
jgi:hypothetical protein